MAKKKDGPTRSAVIREYLTANPGSKANEVVEALGKSGVKVNAGLVYAVKGSMKERKRRKQRVARAALATTDAHGVGHPKADALTMIREVKALALKAGGYRKLKELVEALAE